MKIANNYTLLLWGLLSCISYVQSQWLETDPPGVGPVSTSTISIYTDLNSGTCAVGDVYIAVLQYDWTAYSSSYTTTSDWWIITTIDGTSMGIMTTGTTVAVSYSGSWYSSAIRYTYTTLSTACELWIPSSASPETLPTGSSATTSTISLNGNCVIQQVEEMYYSYTASPTTFPTFSISTTFRYSTFYPEAGLGPYTWASYSLFTSSYTTTVENAIPINITSVYRQTVCDSLTSLPTKSISEPSSSSRGGSSPMIVSSTEISTPSGSSKSSIPLTSPPATFTSSHSYSYVYVTTYINDCGVYSSMTNL